MRNAAVDLTPMPARVADRIVSWLQAQGIQRVFGIPGGAIAPVFDALVDSNLQVVVCQHESMAVYMAYGDARATGKFGVVLVTSGPGVLNTVAAVAAAYQDEVPLLVLAGDVRTDWVGRGAIQDGSESGLDVCGIFRSVVRFQDTLDQPERLESLLEHAHRAVMTHPRGPALLRLPANKTTALSPSTATGRTTPSIAHPDSETIRRIASVLAIAERPALLAGIGVRSAGVADLVERLAHRLRIPVLTDVEGKGALPESDPLCLGLTGVGQSPFVTRYLRAGIDVLVTIGARLDDTSTSGFSDTLRPSKCLVQIDHEPRRLHRPWEANLALASDLRAALTELIEVVGDPKPAQLLARDAAARKGRHGPIEVVPPLGAAPFDPCSVVLALQAVFGDDAVFTSDIGNHLLFATRYLVAQHCGAFHAAIGLGGMGSGLGSAMGLASAYGTARRVVSICGDGGLLMVGNEIATCSRYEIPVVVAVLDNQSLGMVDHGMNRQFGRSAHCGVPRADLVAFARSLGAVAETVTSHAHLVELASSEVRGPLLLRFPIDHGIYAGNPREHGFFEEGAAHV